MTSQCSKFVIKKKTLDESQKIDMIFPTIWRNKPESTIKDDQNVKKVQKTLGYHFRFILNLS